MYFDPNQPSKIPPVPRPGPAPPREPRGRDLRRDLRRAGLAPRRRRSPELLTGRSPRRGDYARVTDIGPHTENPRRSRFPALVGHASQRDKASNPQTAPMRPTTPPSLAHPTLVPKSCYDLEYNQHSPPHHRGLTLTAGPGAETTSTNTHLLQCGSHPACLTHR